MWQPPGLRPAAPRSGRRRRAGLPRQARSSTVCGEGRVRRAWGSEDIGTCPDGSRAQAGELRDCEPTRDATFMNTGLTTCQGSAMFTSVPCAHTGCRADIRSGRRVGLRGRHQHCFDGDLGRGTGSQREGVVFRVVSLGNSVVESPCAPGGSVIGRVSVADASLSLSLSLVGPALS
jgi:hypothetical protein